MGGAYYWFLFERLAKLEHACREYSLIDPLAMWVYHAIDDGIFKHKVTEQFEFDFFDYSYDGNIEELIKVCLNGDRSNVGIIKTCKKIFAEYRKNN